MMSVLGEEATTGVPSGTPAAGAMRLNAATKGGEFCGERSAMTVADTQSTGEVPLCLTVSTTKSNTTRH